LGTDFLNLRLDHREGQGKGAFFDKAGIWQGWTPTFLHMGKICRFAGSKIPNFIQGQAIFLIKMICFQLVRDLALDLHEFWQKRC